ncbi:hypothetical protein AWW70_18995 [Bacillus mycoides]|uniref:Uncharacterized protein n=1 Tax=Bacillus mycoides TaxID=1405 RepID=A0A109G343_BACMY|nr:hypothetical protein AWW70_18995 [Bacillus mycoides]
MSAVPITVHASNIFGNRSACSDATTRIKVLTLLNATSDIYVKYGVNSSNQEVFFFVFSS